MTAGSFWLFLSCFQLYRIIQNLMKSCLPQPRTSVQMRYNTGRNACAVQVRSFILCFLRRIPTEQFVKSEAFYMRMHTWYRIRIWECVHWSTLWKAEAVLRKRLSIDWFPAVLMLQTGPECISETHISASASLAFEKDRKLAKVCQHKTY